MSRSEAVALRSVDRGVVLGMGPREADYWRSVVADPCGCAEGLAGAVSLGALGAIMGPATIGLLAGAGLGMATGAVTGKLYGVTRGLVLARAQRRELGRRIAELDGALTPVH